MSTSEPDTPLTATLERLQALLRRKRRKDGRPENLLVRPYSLTFGLHALLASFAH